LIWNGSAEDCQQWNPAADFFCLSAHPTPALLPPLQVAKETAASTAAAAQEKAAGAARAARETATAGTEAAAETAGRAAGAVQGVGQAAAEGAAGAAQAAKETAAGATEAAQQQAAGVVETVRQAAAAAAEKVGEVVQVRVWALQVGACTWSTCRGRLLSFCFPASSALQLEIRHCFLALQALIHICTAHLNSHILQAAKEKMGIAPEETVTQGAARKTGGWRMRGRALGRLGTGQAGGCKAGGKQVSTAASHLVDWVGRTPQHLAG